MNKYELFFTGGYTGGHVSQQGWDMEVETRALARIKELLPEISDIQDWHNMGNCQGYYPSITLECTREQLAKIKNNMGNINKVKELS